MPFSDLKHHDEAFAAYDKALSFKPDLAEAWLGRGNVFFDYKRFAEAYAAFDKALSLKPDLVAVEGARLYSRMLLCDWSHFEAERDHLIQSVRDGKANTNPFAFFGIGSSVEDQFKCAQSWARILFPPSDNSLWRGELSRHSKIRIGYVSADFRQHPVADLVAGVFECHDRSQFESWEYRSDRTIVRKSVDAWSGLSTPSSMPQPLGADELAKRITEEKIDILIDLNGFTQIRPYRIVARRPAPIQVNYLGYPGTMGASYMDYIVCDPVLVPASHQDSYMEKIVYLPDSYLPHDAASRRSRTRFLNVLNLDCLKMASFSAASTTPTS